MTLLRCAGFVMCLSTVFCLAAAPALDERPAEEGTWGYRPEDGAVCEVTPPSFSWRPMKDIVAWELECARGERFDPSAVEYRAEGIGFSVHCPPRTFPPGKYAWRYRAVDQRGNKSPWSRVRLFTIAPGAVELPLPPRAEILNRVPKEHPRLFLRPEDLPRLRELARGPMKEQFKELESRCERLLKKPPPTAEPPTYPPGTVRLSEPWREIWWGNRLYTIAALDGAATLAFTRRLGGKDEYGQLARRILLECARWDPKGATGFRYNDEAGMPYNYYFSRTYTFLHDLLSEEERQLCRRVMKARGDEMYAVLCPRHFWSPYNSHANRAWHFLGEVGIAFLGEVEGASDWLWFAMNVFANTYPVWSDDDGGWHEGSSYWSSYLERFTWWADVMKSATGIDAFRKPYFARAGYYAMYLMPPGKTDGGFGDLASSRRAQANAPLVSVLAGQAGNGHWQWYVDRVAGPEVKQRGLPTPGPYIAFLRGTRPAVEPKPPGDLPTSRVFRGTGQAYLNSTLEDATQGVQVAFKSSPLGSQSHGYDAQNAFLLSAYGQRLLISSGYRDVHGSDHHRKWMWSTRSVNSITVDGRGQLPHSAASKGRITEFCTTPSIDLVVGEAGACYRTSVNENEGRFVDRFTRAIIFVKPELVIVYDRLAAPRESSFEFWLHAPSEFSIQSPCDVEVKVGNVACPIAFLAPEGLTISQTDRFDPPPRPRVKLHEWHLTASTAKTKNVEFVALFWPHPSGRNIPRQAELTRIGGGYVLSASLSHGRVVALLPVDDAATLRAEGLVAKGQIVVQGRRADGSVVETLGPAF
jgi:hypothetical protein